MKKIIIILLLGIIFSGCATTQYGIEINNVPKDNISAVYIRNSGMADWGSNIVENLDNFDKTRYSAIVDIRVVDTDGVVYSKHNVSLDESLFFERNKTSTPNTWAVAGIVGVLGALIIIFF